MAVERWEPAFVLLLALGAGSVSGQPLPAQPGADTPPCVVPDTPPQAPSPGEAAPPVSRPPRSAPEAVEALPPPISEGEILELIQTLDAAQGRKAADRPKSAPGSPERLRVVLDDVTALLVAVHAREAGHEEEHGDVRSAAEVRQWSLQTLAAIQQCVSGRFDGRGGESAQRQSLALVEKHRAKLEPLVLGLGSWVPAAAAGVPAPERAR